MAPGFVGKRKSGRTQKGEAESERDSAKDGNAGYLAKRNVCEEALQEIFGAFVKMLADMKKIGYTETADYGPKRDNDCSAFCALRVVSFFI